MKISIELLRRAVKSVLPLVQESYRGNGYGAFVPMDGSLWCVSGSFTSKFGAARVCELDEGYENIVDRYINLRDLHQFLTISFSGDYIKVTSTSASLKFAVGIDSMSFRFKMDESFGRMVSLPSLSDSLELTDYAATLSVAHAAADNNDGIISGVYVDIGETVQMVAMDRYVTGYSCTNNDSHPPVKALIPGDFLLYALRLFWETSPRLRIKGNKCWIFSDEFFVFTSLMSEVDRYPGDQLFAEIKKNSDRSAQVDSFSLLNRLGAFTNIDYRGKNDLYTISAVKFDFDDDKGMLVLSASSSDGSVEEGGVNIPFSGQSSSWLINVNSIRKIGNIMKTLLSSPSLVFYGHDRGWMMITPGNNNNVVFAIAPMAH